MEEIKEMHKRLEVHCFQLTPFFLSHCRCIVRFLKPNTLRRAGQKKKKKDIMLIDWLISGPKDYILKIREPDQ